MNARFGRPCTDCDAATDQQCDETCPSPAWLGERDGLSAHEGAIVSLIVLGLSNQEVAGALHVSMHSTKTHIRSAYRKMGVTKRTQAISWGVHHGLRLTAPAARLNEGGEQ